MPEFGYQSLGIIKTDDAALGLAQIFLDIQFTVTLRITGLKKKKKRITGL